MSPTVWNEEKINLLARTYCKTKDRQTYEALASEVQPLVYMIAAKKSLDDFDFAISYGNDGFMRAAEFYSDPKLPFFPYCSKSIQNGIRDYLRKRNRIAKFERGDNRVFEYMGDKDKSNRGISDIHREELKRVIEEDLEEIPEAIRRDIRLFLLTGNWSEVSRLLGFNRCSSNVYFSKFLRERGTDPNLFKRSRAYLGIV